MLLQNSQAEFVEAIMDNEKSSKAITPTHPIAIYRNNILVNLTRTLQTTYPLIEKLVGNDFFVMLAHDYINRYPARTGNLHDYGEYLSAFIAEYQPLKKLAYLIEIAQFEWICHSLSIAENPPIFNIRTLENILPSQYDQLYFSLHPASHLCHFNYPLIQIIDLCQNENNENINLNAGGVDLLIIRRHLDICLAPLSPGEFRFLQAINDSQTVSKAIDIALAIDTNFKLHEKLPKWIKDRTIVHCHLKNELQL